MIEHHLDVIKCADHLIDLGPYGGDRGGELIAEGTPEDIARVKKSFTGDYLRPILEAAGTLKAAAPKRAAASKNGKAPEATEPAEAVATKPVARGRSNGAKGIEESASAAAASIGERISRESAPMQERPKTKAALKRERQAAHPRKETASEKDLRETRIRRPGKAAEPTPDKSAKS